MHSKSILATKEGGLVTFKSFENAYGSKNINQTLLDVIKNKTHFREVSLHFHRSEISLNATCFIFATLDYGQPYLLRIFDHGYVASKEDCKTLTLGVDDIPIELLEEIIFGLLELDIFKASPQNIEEITQFIFMTVSEDFCNFRCISNDPVLKNKDFHDRQVPENSLTEVIKELK